MADIIYALEKLWDVEYSSQPARFLHKNKNEDGYTLGGIYQKYHSTSIDWNFVNKIMEACNNSITRASRMLFYDLEIQTQIRTIYLNEYWHKMKLDRVKSQDVANNIFLFGVVSGVRNASKQVQKVLEVEQDGIIGNITLERLNSIDPDLFNSLFDLSEIKYFENLVATNSELSVFLSGWKNRAMYV